MPSETFLTHYSQTQYSNVNGKTSHVYAVSVNVNVTDTNQNGQSPLYEYITWELAICVTNTPNNTYALQHSHNFH